MENNSSDEKITKEEKSSLEPNQNKEDDSKKILSSKEKDASLKRLNKDIRVYTMPEEFFNKKYQISRAKRLMESKKEQELMEAKRVAEEKKRMKRIEKENKKAEKEKKKRLKIEAENAEKLRKEYEKRQALIKKNREKREKELEEKKAKKIEELKKKKELALKEIEEKKLKEIKKQKEKDGKKNRKEKEKIKKESSILNNSSQPDKKPKLKEKKRLNFGFNFRKKKNFEDSFSNTIDGDIASSNINKNIDKKIIDSTGDVNQNSNIKKAKKSENNFLFIFISIIVFIISVVITILISYRNGDWFYYEEEIDVNNNDIIYWNDLIEDETPEENGNKLVGDSDKKDENIEDQNKEDHSEDEYEEENDLIDSENTKENNNDLQNSEDFSYYYEKCDFFITNSNFPVSSDTDFDCLTDKEESIYNTISDNIDTDSDSYIDGMEVSYVYDPLSNGKIYNNSNLKEYKDEENKFSFYYPKLFRFNTIDNRLFRIIPEENSEEYFEIEFLGKFDLSSLGRITKTEKIKQIEAWVSDSSDYVYVELSNGDILRFYYNFANVDSLSYQASFSLIVRSVYIW